MAADQQRRGTLHGMTFDVIIVGGGAAGCVIAARLSEDPDCRVALIEAGSASRSPLLTIPGLGAFAARGAWHMWRHPSEPETGLDGRPPVLLQGRVLGGGSSVNGMVYTRGHAYDYDAWAEPGWRFADVLPFFRRAETNERGASDWHGGDGPLRVRRSMPASPLPARFLEAAASAGFAILDDLNTNAVDAFGLTDVTIDGGRRSSTRAAYLEPALHRPNLTVLTGRSVLRIRCEGGRAIGVEVTGQGGVVLLRAEREIILTAGGLKTPHLLLLSGIGPAAQLAACGIPVQVDAPEVGRNLQNHPSFPLRYRGGAPDSLARYVTPLGALRAAVDYATARRGILAEGLFAAAGFFRTDPALLAPDAQVVMSPALMPAGDARGLGLLPREHGVTLAVQQGTPFSRGDVTLRSADPLAPPRIRTGAFSDPRDIAILSRAIAVTREIMSQSAMRGLVPERGAPASPEAEIRALSGTAYHYCGTCRMGSDATAVVDAALRVRGIQGLRVADASIIPRIPNAALHAPTVMIAERAAALISAMD
ncbi:GMC family oxidoreductase [Humitalea sp. 24SJ18S-53]|uniref:GMC family oxidoreductase n=1 Tax=Humitalea sp. 24SJ18S-53 TaxID=3422307 RepID=UPI003D67B8A4